MEDDQKYTAVPQRLVNGIGQLGAAPLPGTGRLKFDFSISLGNILTLLGILVAFGFGWIRMEGRISALEILQTEHRDIMEKTQHEVAQMRKSVDHIVVRDNVYPPHVHLGDQTVYQDVPGLEHEDPPQKPKR